MRETKFYCDHCGKELTNNDYCYIGGEISTPIKFVEADLCQDCMKKLDKLISDYINKDEKEAFS